MPKTAAKDDSALSLMETGSKKLIQQIEDNIKEVATQKLIPFYCRGDAIVKRIKSLMEASRKEIILRRDEGQAAGDEGQHRLFTFDGLSLQVQSKGGKRLNVDKAEKRLKKLGIYEECVDLTISEGVENLSKFLRKHRAELKEFGIVVTPVLNEEKIDSLAKLNKIGLEDVAYMYEDKGISYSLVPVK